MRRWMPSIGSSSQARDTDSDGSEDAAVDAQYRFVLASARHGLGRARRCGGGCPACGCGFVVASATHADPRLRGSSASPTRQRSASPTRQARYTDSYEFCIPDHACGRRFVVARARTERDCETRTRAGATQRCPLSHQLSLVRQTNFYSFTVATRRSVHWATNISNTPCRSVHPRTRPGPRPLVTCATAARHRRFVAATSPASTASFGCRPPASSAHASSHANANTRRAAAPAR